MSNNDAVQGGDLDAVILPFPKPMKRRKKTRRGPNAEVHVLYEPKASPQSVAKVTREAREAELMARIVASAERKRAEWTEIASRPYVILFPKCQFDECGGCSAPYPAA